MDLVIDANIIISSLIVSESKNFDLIFNDNLRLFAPEFLKQEIEKYKQEITKKSNLLEYEFNLFLGLIFLRIDLIPHNEFKEFRYKAKELSPDQNDSEYFALALKLKCPIWTNDKKLKSQDKIKIYSTQELLSELK